MDSSRITRRFVHRVNASSATVFPLLCPVREHDYLEDWNAEILFSESGLAEEGCVFQTVSPDGQPSVWTITRHDERAGVIEFIIFTPSSHVSKLDIWLVAESDSVTSVTFTYTHTAIGPRGERFLEGFTERSFVAKMQAFESAINDYLTRPGAN